MNKLCKTLYTIQSEFILTCVYTKIILLPTCTCACVPDIHVHLETRKLSSTLQIGQIKILLHVTYHIIL